MKKLIIAGASALVLVLVFTVTFLNTQSAETARLNESTRGIESGDDSAIGLYGSGLEEASDLSALGSVDESIGNADNSLATPSSAPTPTPTPTPKATPVATPKPTPKATPKPTPKATPVATPKPALKAPVVTTTPATTTVTSTTASKVIATAKSYLGVPYVWGGTSSSGFDCSGYIQYVFNKNGINLPRVTSDQYKVGTSISKSNLIPGDLVFFETYKPGASHVGIYLGNNQFIHASSGGEKVMISNLTSTYYTSHYLGARRVIK